MTGVAPTTRLEPANGSRQSSHVFVGAAMVAFITIALLKPWAADDAPGDGARTDTAAGTARPTAAITPRTSTTTSDTFATLRERARPYAGRPVVVGRSIPRYGTPVTTVLHRTTGRAKTTASTAGWCAGGVWFDSPQRAVALGYVRPIVPDLGVSVIARNGSRAPVTLAIDDAVTGLLLAAPAGGMGWLPGRYDVTLTYAERGGLSHRVERFMLCFRSPPRTTP